MEIIMLRISQIEPDRNQPRKYFDEQLLLDLSISIAEHGVIEPIIVKPLDNGFYKIIAGERRWRASRMANLREIPAIIKENISELEAFKISFNENLQRQSLTPIEEALGYVRLIDEFHLTQNEVAQATGKGRTTITNSIRLLNLPKSVQNMVSTGKLSVGNAKVILSAERENQEKLAEICVCNGLTVKQLDLEVKKLQSKPKEKRFSNMDKHFKEVELALIDTLNRPVKVSGTANRGTITLEFYGTKDLDNLVNLLDK